MDAIQPPYEPARQSTLKAPLAATEPAGASSAASGASGRLGPVRIARRNYAAGDVNRLSAAFARTPLPFDGHVYQSQRVVRARSREAARNDGLIRRFLGLLVTNVIGADAIRLQAQPHDADGNLDKLAADSIERAWREWSKAENCDLAGELDFGSMQRLAVRQIARDGELLVEESIGPTAGPWGYALTLIDPERLDREMNVDLPDGGRIVMGVETDSHGRRRAYHVVERGAGAISSLLSGYAGSGREHRRIPAERMLHLFLREDADQTRGMPWTAAALPNLQQLGAFEEAAIVRARAATNKVAFVKTTEGSDLSSVKRDEDGGLIEELEPATVEYLEAGQELQVYDPSYASGDFEPFVKAVTRRLASALETSYNSLASDLEGLSFSTLRQAVIDDRDLWRVVQGWFGLAFCNRIFKTWLVQSASFGHLIIPGFTPIQMLANLDRLRQVRWQGRGWDWVDPVKDIVANKEAIALGTMTVSEIIRARGRDPQEVFAERAAELKELAAMGILPPEPKVGADALLLAEGKEGAA